MAPQECEAELRADSFAGVLLVLTAAVAWSAMGLFVRMTPNVDLWTVVFWRSIFGGLSISALAMIEHRRMRLDWRRTMTPAGLAIIALIASGIFAAIYSMQNTTIANACVIASTVPFMAACLAWGWFRERPGGQTVACALVASAGVVVTVSGTLLSGGAHLGGDLAMMLATFSLALMTVITRRYRDTPMLESVAVACFVAAACSCWFADPWRIPAGDIALLAVFGIITQGGGLGLYTMGARRLPSAQAALLSSAELPMSPLWVWIFFSEAPSVETILGGVLVLGAVVWNVGMGMRTTAQSRADLC